MERTAPSREIEEPKVTRNKHEREADQNKSEGWSERSDNRMLTAFIFYLFFYVPRYTSKCNLSVKTTNL